MAFAAPWALLGLLLAALPVLLHLVQRRDPPERSFPAVRYLEDATRDHRRQLRLRHLLLLAMRTVLIVALVLAAAGATLHRPVPWGSHPPSALVLVFDHSASSAAVVDGEPVLEALRRAADAVLAQATPADRLWVIPVDGTPRSGSAEELRAVLAALSTVPQAGDLGAAVSLARDLLAGVDRPGEVVVVTDAQRSALGPVRGAGALLVLRPAGVAPANRGLVGLDAGPQPWGGDGGRVVATLAAGDTAPAAAALLLEGRAAREVLLLPGRPTSMRIPPPPTGWSIVTLALAPDEFRLDDTARAAVRVAPPTAVRWEPGDRWLDAALGVLASDGRIRPGDEVRLGSVGRGPSIVLPPEDPALLPALNRALAARGASWRYGASVTASARLDSTAALPFRPAIHRHVALEPLAAVPPDAEVLLRVDGAPWAVRTGDLILLGSRLTPAWSDLPVAAAFVPLLDLLLTRAIWGEPPTPVVSVGAPVMLPGRATGVLSEGRTIPVEGGGRWRPATPGLHVILRGADTLGIITAMLPPGESDLTRATDRELRDRWPGVVVRPLDEAAGAAFGLAGRGDLRLLLLLVALGAVVGESLLAGRGRGAVR